MSIRWGTHRKIKRTFQWKHWNRRNQKFLMKIVNDYLKNHIQEGVIKRTVQTVQPRSQWVWRKNWVSTHAQIFLNYVRKLLRNTAILVPLPLKLLPIHEVLHKIPLIDESKQLKHGLPKCPEAFCSELTWKLKQYTTSGWWVPAAAKQATPMLCIPKKNGILRTIFNATAEQEHMERYNTFPRSRCDMSWYSAS